MSVRHTASDAERQAIMDWRRGTRQRLIAERLRISVADRQAASARIAVNLDALLGDVQTLLGKVR